MGNLGISISAMDEGSQIQQENSVPEVLVVTPGADPGLILGCCKILQKRKWAEKWCNMQKNYRFSKKQDGIVLLTGMVQIWR